MARARSQPSKGYQKTIVGIGRSPFANGLECQTRTLIEFNGFSSEQDGSQMNAQSSRGREPKPIKGWPGSDNTTQTRPVDQTPSVSRMRSTFTRKTCTVQQSS